MRGLGNVRLGDLYIKGRYRECLRQAGRRRRTKTTLKYGYYCANKLRNTRAAKRFCRQYLRLNLADGHSNSCRHLLKR